MAVSEKLFTSILHIFMLILLSSHCVMYTTPKFHPVLQEVIKRNTKFILQPKVYHIIKWVNCYSLANNYNG